MPTADEPPALLEAFCPRQHRRFPDDDRPIPMCLSPTENHLHLRWSRAVRSDSNSFCACHVATQG